VPSVMVAGLVGLTITLLGTPAAIADEGSRDRSGVGRLLHLA
jgi:hypothetical protein